MADYTWQPIIGGGVDTSYFINQYQTQTLNLLGLTQNIQVIFALALIGLITIVILSKLFGILAPLFK